MHLARGALPILSWCVSSTLADFLAGPYPPPYDLSSEDSLVRASWQNLSARFDAYLRENQTEGSATLAGVENVTFSVGMFSLNDPAAGELQYHYASPETVNAVNGTNEVDGDSIYRMASVTKLFTVFAGMLAMTDAEWNRPLSQVFPVLAEYSREHPSEDNWSQNIAWDQLTAWALANQQAGFPGGGWPALDTLAILAAAGDVNAYVTELGFPPPDLSQLGPCYRNTDPAPEEAYCTADQFIIEASSLAPSFLTWTSPAYTNAGFIMLGLTIANITGRPLETIYRESIFTPLGMDSSLSAAPTSQEQVARSVIVGTPAEWFHPGGISTPSGGLFSTINDLDKFGINILNSTLLPSNVTRKWMKPTSFTASLNYANGAPWEIIRYINPSTGKVTDLYTKLGDSGPQGGDLVLIPEYNAGFSFLNGAGNSTLRGTAANLILDHVGDAVIPALEAQAAAEARRKFVGTYVASDPNLNASITISFNESTVAGSIDALSISQWISNGTDALPVFNGDIPRLQVSIPKQVEGRGRVAFKAVTNLQTTSYVPITESGLGPFSGSFLTNSDWILGDSIGSYYAKKTINLFVFDVDEEGRATAVTPDVTGVTLQRREETQ